VTATVVTVAPATADVVTAEAVLAAALVDFYKGIPF